MDNLGLHSGLRRKKLVIIILSHDAVTSAGQFQNEKTAHNCIRF
jgi:hypothetical protein